VPATFPRRPLRTRSCEQIALSAPYLADDAARFDDIDRERSLAWPGSRRLAVDDDGDGRRDIWSSRADTLYSIGNYFRDAGWRRGQPWGVRATIPAGLNWGALETSLVAPVCPRVHVRHSKWKTVAEWKALGVQPQNFLADSTMASLFAGDLRSRDFGKGSFRCGGAERAATGAAQRASTAREFEF
jgi:hypothetical protein